MKINIKPLSINSCFQGRRFKTKRYKAYELEMQYLLPKDYKVPLGRLKISIKVGFSSPLADLDNIAKPLIDILQKKYGFNDKKIFKAILEKEIVKKGNEYIDWKITKYNKTI